MIERFFCKRIWLRNESKYGNNNMENEEAKP
jgi:hypothetical protein